MRNAQRNAGNLPGESIKEQLEVLCSYYLAADEFGREMMLSAGRKQSVKHPIQLPRQLHLVQRAGLNPKAKLINEVIDRLPLTLIR